MNLLITALAWRDSCDTAAASGECSSGLAGGHPAPEAFWRGDARPPQAPTDHGMPSTSGRFAPLPKGSGSGHGRDGGASGAGGAGAAGSRAPRTIGNRPGNNSGNRPGSGNSSSSSGSGGGGGWTGAKTRTAPTAGRDRQHQPLPQPQSAPDPAALTAWIKSARDVGRLERLVRQHGERMNHIHVSAAITHLAQLAAADPAVSETLEAAAGAAAAPAAMSAATAPSEPAQGAAVSAGQAVRAARGGDGGTAAVEQARALAEALLRLLRSRLPDCEPRQLANTAWALGKWPAGLCGRREALLEVARAAASQLGRFRPQELSNLLHGCASVVASTSATAATAAAAGAAGASTSAAAAPAEGTFAEAALPAAFLRNHAHACAAVLQRTLARSGSHASRADIDSISTGSTSNVTAFKMQELSNLLWAWGALLGSDSPDVVAGDADSGGSGGSGGSGSSPRAAAVPSAGRRPGAAAARAATLATGEDAPPPHLLPCMDVLAAQLALGLGAAGPQELANSVHGLARLQIEPTWEWVDAAMAAARRHVRHARPQPLLQQPQQPQQPPSVTGPSASPSPSSSGSSGRAAGFSPRELSNWLWGCSRLRLRLPRALLEGEGEGELAAALERCLPAMNLQERVNVLWALAWQAKLGVADWQEQEPQQGCGQGAEQEQEQEQEGAVRTAGHALQSHVWRGAQSVVAVPPSATVGASQAHGHTGAHAAATTAAAPQQSALGRQGPAPRGSHAAPSQPHAVPAAGDAGGGSGDRGGALSGSVLNGVLRSVLDAATASSSASAVAGATAAASRGSKPLVPPTPSTLAAALARKVSAASRSAAAAPATVAPAAAAQMAPLHPLTARRAQDVSVTLWSLATLHCAGIEGLDLGASTRGGGSGTTRGQSSGHGNSASAGAADGDGNGANRASNSTERGRQQPTLAAARATTAAQQLLQLWQDALPHMGPQALSNSVWAAARLRLRLTAPLTAGVLAALRRHGRGLAPPEAAAVVRGLGMLCATLPLAPSAAAPEAQQAAAPGAQLLQPQQGATASAGDLVAVVLGLLEHVYIRHASYSLGQLAQVCYGGALLLRWAGGSRQLLQQPQPQSAASRGASGDGSDGDGDGGLFVPAALEIRMSLDLDDDMVYGSSSVASAAAAAAAAGLGPGAAAAAAAARAQQRRLIPPLDWLLLQLQLAYRGRAAKAASAAAGGSSGGEAGAGGTAAPVGVSVSVEEVAMTLQAVGLLLPEGASMLTAARCADLAAWGQDLTRMQLRRVLAAATAAAATSAPPPHVRQLAPLLHAVAMAAVGSVHAARIRRAAAAERLRRASGAAPPGGGPAGGGPGSPYAGEGLARSSVDEFVVSGRKAARREEHRLQQLVQQVQQQQGAAVAQPEATPATAAAPPDAAAASARSVPPATSANAATASATSGRFQPAQTHVAQPQPTPTPVPMTPQQQGGLLNPASPSPAWQASGLSPEWLARFWALTGPSLAEASPQEAALLLCALGALSVRPPEPWAHALLAAVRPHLRARPPLLPQAAGAATTGVAVAAAAAYAPSPALSDQTLGLLILGLGKTHVAPPREWMVAALAEVEARASGGAACNAAAAAAAAASASAPAGSTATPQPQPPQPLDPRVLKCVLAGLAELEWPLPAEWLTRVVVGAAPRLRQLRPADRSRMYLSLVALDAGLADRMGYDFCHVIAAAAQSQQGGAGGGGAGAGGAGAGGGGAGGSGGAAAVAVAGTEGAGQQRSLFTRSRGGWR
ncbi:hypothetical protein HYH02_003323 [Chlamydomonas schloesseri]|uniref:RAP domain-containing protein n=1 Tax=Chlamydomonas schloesseri TaxID=2026947 RepID=A0A835WRW5_9CHLO|nr:hypothetical protein HYH02_003323 [Chlamydomonas schloesseri]|eukprot:KAG2452299.1 hypothetical protein HYH02_003323 [Chlamydomonas schloesseri]